MKTFAVRQAFHALLLLICTLAYQASANVVGYINLRISAGDNLIANQLDLTGTGNNTLDELFSSPVVPDGTTFTKWDPLAKAFLPVSTYNALSSTWSINYSFNTFADGQGALLHSPSLFTNTFVGNVVPYTNIVPELGGPIWAPNYTSGLYLLGCPVPLSGAMDMMFTNVVGRLPHNGEWVEILNPVTQTYTTTTFHTGTGWDNGDPTLSAGEAAWFDLGPVVVPEPTSFALIGSGAATLALFRRRRA